MPYSKSTRRTTKRSRTNGGNGRYVRRSSYSSPYSLLRSLPVGGVSQTKLTKLVFCDLVTLDCPSNSHVFGTVLLNNPANVLNATNNPQSAGNMSTWVAIYQKWTVLGCKVTFTLTPDHSVNTAKIPGFMGIYKSFDDGATLQNILSNGIPQVMEQPRNMVMKAIPYAFGNKSSDSSISCYVDIAKFFSIPQTGLYVNEDDFSGTGISVGATAPVRKAFAQVWVGNINGNDPGALTGIMKVEYIIRWSEPKDTRAL